MKAVDTIALILLIVGGINWALVGLFDFDLVASLFGTGEPGDAGTVGTIIYVLVGLAALWAISFFGRLVESSRYVHREIATEHST